MTATWDEATLDAFAKAYTRKRRRKVGAAPAATTVRGKCTHVLACARLAGATSPEDFAALLADRAEVDELLDALSERMSSGAMRNVVYALLDYAEFAVPDCALTREDVPPRNPDPAISVYSAAEMESFIEASRAKGLRWWAFMTFVADTGRRVGETLSLRWEWLRLSETPAYFELPTNKTGRPQYVPLTTRLRDEVFTPDNIDALKGERRTGARAFERPPDEYPFPWAYTTVRTRFERFCRATGLPDRGFHVFRHSVITSRLAKGVPIQAVSALAGHSSVATTDRRYNHTQALQFWRYVEDEKKNGDESRQGGTEGAYGGSE